MAEEIIKSVSLKKAAKFGVVRNISAVRTNESGYPYVTMLSGDKASNVYFGKKSAESVHKGDVLTGVQLRQAQLVLATNEAGEPRVKISLNGENAYTSLADELLEDDITADEKAVLVELKSTMVAKEAQEPVGATA